MVRESPSNPNFAGFESELSSDRGVILNVLVVLRISISIKHRSIL